MSFRFNLRLAASMAVSTLILAGCQGLKSATPAPNTFLLTVAQPPANSGTITSSPAGINCPGTCAMSFAQGTPVTLTATPATNYTFGGWGGACTGTGTCSVTLNAAANVTDTFTPGSGNDTVSITLAGSGTGTVTSSPAGINCSTATGAACSASFAPGTAVTLTETPATGSVFTSWTGCTGTTSCSITLSNASNPVTATFAANDTVTVTLAGTGTGTVTSSPAGINCSTATGAICTAMFTQGTVVTLTEAPASNSVFTSWTGCTGTTSCSITLSASANPITATFTIPTLQTSINHIIFFAQENRSFDHYFGYMRQYWANNGITDQSFDGLPQFNPVSGIAPLYGPPPSVPGCELANDVASCVPDFSGANQITSFSFDDILLPSGKTGTVCEENQSPFWNEAHNDWSIQDPADQTGAPAALNGFVFTSAYDGRSNGFMDVNGVRGIGYFTDKDLNLDYALATDYATSDRWFSPLMDRTQLNRAYFYAATTQGYAYPPGGGTNDNKPFSAITIFQVLENAGISWKIYVDPTNAIYTATGENCATAAPGQDQDLCLAGVSYMNQFTYESTIQNDPSNNLWQHFAPISQFAIDLQNDATFPAYAMIEPSSSAGLDEHPSDADISPVNIQHGEQYFQQNVLTPFLQSPTYKDSAMVITYDEAGGLYDHVAPQPAPPPADDPNPIDLVSGDICDKPGEILGTGTCTFGWTGYRVPLIVISPFARKNFVSHTQRDTTAVLAMVESRFGLTALTARDASQAPMDEFFDYVNIPNATPPTLPTQSTAGNCDQTPPAAWNEPPELTVTVTGFGVTGAGTGQITSSPSSAINQCATECTGVFATGTVVTLTATPTGSSTFGSWGGECSGNTTCTITVGTHDYVTATFNP